jgi:two-component system cell cycle response regulator CpdR
MACTKDALITHPPHIASEDTAPTATPMSAPLRILYVEDNAIVREITSELLAQDQREIVSCATAEEALKAFAANRFDLVITDVSLPAMSGIELARSILQLKPRVPIILASGYDLDFAVENWAANVRSIIKPFEADEIEALMSKLIKG